MYIKVRRLTARFIPETAPSVVVTASANNVYQGTPLTFTATTLNAGTPTDYHWQVNGKSAGTNSATFTSNTLNNGDVVTCTITTNLGCIISAAGNNITVSIIPTPPITAPNTFTPNGDGINDTWKLSNLSFYPNMSIKVFNRYGLVVFQSQGYTKQWDGTEVNNNRALPDGVYFYVIDPGNNAPELSGWVAIIR